MKRIIFIDPEGVLHGFNIGLAYISASLAQKGHDVRVLDFNNNRHSQEARLENVKGVDIIGLSVKTFTAKESVRVAERAKKLNKKALIICGGPHIAIDGPDFLARNSVFDLGVVSEGEYILPEIASGKDLADIRGIIYRDGNKIIETQRDGFIQDLDKLPLPDYDCFDLDKRREAFLLKRYPLFTSRGCPFRCIFCASWLSMGRKWRARSAQHVIQELLMVKEKREIVEFQIHDDNFIIDIDRAKQICQALIDNKVNLRWSCPSGLKANKLDEGLVSLMKQSGCYSVNIGIETGIEEIFDRIDKGGTLKDIKMAVEMLKYAGIQVIGFFIIGLPGSTFELDKRSVDFARNLNLNLAVWAIVQPYKGTALYRMLEEDKNTRILTDWRDTLPFGNEVSTMFETEKYSARERLRMYYLANLQCGTYVAFIKQNGSLFEKVFHVLGVILRYDPIHLFNHLFRVSLVFLRSLRRRHSLC